MSQILESMLVDALKAHGVPCRLEGGRVIVLDGALSVQARATPKSTNNGGVLLQLDFGAEAPQLQGRTIWTSFAGFGADEETATAQGFTRFMMGPLHVMLAALAGHVCDGASEEWRTLSGKIEWEVCESPLVTLGISDPHAVPIKHVVDRLMTSFASVAESGVHWGDVFFSYINGDRSGLDVRLDGEPWLDGTEVLADWNWVPPDKGYAGGRYFFLAQPKRPTGK